MKRIKWCVKSHGGRIQSCHFTKAAAKRAAKKGAVSGYGKRVVKARKIDRARRIG